jgi:hypothetical protein
MIHSTDLCRSTNYENLLRLYRFATVYGDAQTIILVTAKRVAYFQYGSSRYS